MESKDDITITNLKTLNEFLSMKDNSENSPYVSPIPQMTKDFPCVLGIDEAGRGPVLGPMVYGAAFCPKHKMAQLLDLECADSKALTEEKRDAIFKRICKASETIGWAVEVISPNFICKNMLSRNKYSLNQVSMDSAINLIRTAKEMGVDIEHVYVDTVGPPEKYQEYLLRIFPEYKITVAKKADSTYPIVSAASICAKVARDHALQVWNFQEEITLSKDGFGSGYPGDPVTKRFLVEHSDPVFGFPTLVRFSWSTAEKAMEESTYHVEWEEESGAPEPSNNTSITSFFALTKKKSVARSRHEFFKCRNLTSTSQL